MKRIYLQSLGVWVALFALAVVNGGLRGLYAPLVGDLVAHQISTATGITLFAVAMYLFLRATSAPYTRRDLIGIGALWLGMTITLEFIFGHYVMGHTWAHLLADYNLLAGRVWILVLVWTAIGLWVVDRVAVERTRAVRPTSDGWSERERTVKH